MSSRERFDRPILIVSTPRSGSTLLFETLAQAPELFTVGTESHGIIERFPQLSPYGRDWDSNRLIEQDATEEIAEQLSDAFHSALRDRSGNDPSGRVRMLEKTPKNAVRVPFFDALWPDAMFIYLYRDPRPTLASMMRAWQSGRFRTYPRLPGWQGLPWSLLLVPGWRQLNGRPLHEIVARQWAITTDTLISDLSALPLHRVRTVDYDAFLASPQQVIEQLADSVGLRWDVELPGMLPPSRMTLTLPDPEKWRDLESEVTSMLPTIAEADGRAREFRRKVALGA